MTRKPPGGVSPGRNISKEAAKLINRHVEARAAGKGDRIDRPSDMIDWARREFPDVMGVKKKGK